MDDVEGKRVFDDRADREELVVAAGLGVLSVSVSAGRFDVVHRCTPADVASAGGRVAVATDADVLLREPSSEGFGATDFGPAVAVGFVDGRPTAASPDGRVARRDGAEGDSEWVDLGRVDGTVRAMDGRLVAASDGVYRLPGMDFAGLDDVRDVAAAGPLAATGDGLYSLGNGWMVERDGDFHVAGSDGTGAHAATAHALLERRADGWAEVDLPADGPVAAVAYGSTVYAVAADGVVLAGRDGGWEATPLGVDGVVGCAVA